MPVWSGTWCARPGVGEVTETDRRWSRLVTEIAAEVGVPVERFFRANDDELVLVDPAQVK
jgi:hypothetical protein